MLAGLDFVHGKGIIHNDLKTGNALLTSADDADASVKLTDFGLSRSLDAARSHVSTQSGTMIYSSPEKAAQGHSSAAGVTGRRRAWSLFALCNFESQNKNISACIFQMSGKITDFRERLPAGKKYVVLKQYESFLTYF